jgi:ubiquinone biosynthesis protein COQ9
VSAQAASLEEVQETLLLATLPHVAFDGWTQAALRAGAADAGLSSEDVARAFPGGAVTAIEVFNRRADRRMIEAVEKLDTAHMRTHEKIAAAIRARLEDVTPHKEAVRRALTVLAFPPNAPLALRMLHRTVDAAWHAAGDRSTDFNWYTKRGLLAGVYSATVLYWLNDKSEGHADTWAFLDRRLQEVMRAGGTIARAMKAMGEFRSPFGPPGGPYPGPFSGRR